MVTDKCKDEERSAVPHVRHQPAPRTDYCWDSTRAQHFKFVETNSVLASSMNSFRLSLWSGL